MRNALRRREQKPAASTLAEGIAVKTPGELTLPIVRDLVDQIIVLDEAAIENAVEIDGRRRSAGCRRRRRGGRWARSGRPELFRDRVTGLVVSGGNIDMRVFASVLLRGLVRGGQLVRLRIQITDAPGNLARVTRLSARPAAISSRSFTSACSTMYR